MLTVFLFMLLFAIEILQTLFKNTDAELDKAKNRGKSTCVIFTDSMNLDIVEKLKLEHTFFVFRKNSII